MGSYNTTMGSLLLGILFNTFLYGLVVQQFVAYYQTKFNDPPAIKFVVAFLFFLDTFHSFSVIYMAWNYFVTNHNGSAALKEIGWPYVFTPLSTALAALVTQIFLGHRILRLTKNKTQYGLIILMAITSFTLGVVCSVETWNANSYELPLVTALVISWLSTQVSVDVFIAMSLIIFFSSSRTNISRTDTVLDRLTFCVIRTGLLAAMFCMAILVTFIAFPGTGLHGMFVIPIGRVYTITLLYSLLIRESLKTDLASPISISLPRFPPSSSNSPVDWRSTRSARITGDV